MNTESRPRPWEIVFAALLVIALIAVFVGLRQMRPPQPSPTPNPRVPLALPQPPEDRDLIFYNALSFHFLALKSDPGSFEQVRRNLVELAMPESTHESIPLLHKEILTLCGECESFYARRKDLEDRRNEQRAEAWKAVARRAGTFAVGSAAESTVTGTNAFTLSAIGTFAVVQGARTAWDSRQSRAAFDEAVEQAQAGLNDRFARVAHSFSNLRAEKAGWPEALVLTQIAFRSYTDGMAKLASGEYAASIPDLERSAAMPGLHEALFFLGIAYEADADFADAATAYRNAIERHPREFLYEGALVAESHARLARLSLREKKWDAALEHAQAALEGGATSETYYCLYGDILLAQGHEGQAEAAYRQALQLNPQSAAGAFGLSQTLAKQDRPQDALEWLEKAKAGGALDLSLAQSSEHFIDLRNLPQFQQAVELKFEAEVDWGPLSDKIILTNRNLFPVTGVEATVTRINQDSEPQVEQVRVDALDPAQSMRIAGAIGKGPKSRTTSFKCQVTCDQGKWQTELAIPSK